MKSQKIANKKCLSAFQEQNILQQIEEKYAVKSVSVGLFVFEIMIEKTQ